MNGAFYIGATGLGAQQRALEVVANNITNVNTPGFKRTQARFSEMVSPTGESGAATSLVAVGPALLGVSTQPSSRDFAQGSLQTTGRPLDLAISGAGFIELAGPNGQTLLWRGGALQVNGDGFLAAASGGMPLKAMISVPATAADLTVGADGKVMAVVDGSDAPQVIGQIDLVQSKDMATLSPLDGGLYLVGNEADVVASAPGEDGAGVLLQGSLEGSNVQLTDEMVTLLLLQRAYAASAEVVQAGDQLMGIANSLRR